MFSHVSHVRLPLLALVFAFLASCGGGDGGSTTPTVATVTVSPATATITVSATQQLTATAKDSGGTTISGATFTYTSSDTSIATVSTTGLVTGVAAGSATITATSGGINGTAAITVQTPTSVSGTAATGAAIANTTITLVDSLGASTTATTGADGSFTIDTTGMTPPFMLKIATSGGATLYSVSADASDTSTINVDPLTDLIIRTWYSVQGSSVDTGFSNPAAAPPPTPTQVQLINDVVVKVVQLWLEAAGVDTTNLNLISTTFSADGSGIDGVLDQTTVDTSTGTITVTSTTTTQTTTITYNSTDSTVTVTTTTTSGSSTTSSSTTSTVPTSDAASTAFSDIQAQFNAFAVMVNSKGSALTADDILPYTTSDLLDQGHDQATFAANTVTSLRGQTVAFNITNVTSLDTTAGTAHVYFDATFTQGGQSQTESVDFYMAKSGGAWLISGDHRRAQISVDASMRTYGGSNTAIPGPDINVDVQSPQNSLSAVVIDGGPFSNKSLSVNSTRLDTYMPTPTTSVDVYYDAYYTDTGVLSQAVAAGTPINVTVTPTGGTAESYEFKVNAFTNDPVQITNLTGTTLQDANLGGTLNVTWTLPTTYSIKEVKLNGHVFDASNTDCETTGPVLSNTATSASISLPTTCGGNPAARANLSVSVRGVNGERSDAEYEFGTGAAATVSTVAVTPSSATLNVGAIQQLTPTAKDSNGGSISGASFTYASSDSTVASVDSNGLVTANAAGTATITATSGGVGGTTAITVNTPTSVSGTASAGAPIANTTITLVDSLGASTTAMTGSDGSFTIDTSGMTPPFMLQITTGAVNLYSVSADANADSVVNISPLTDLIIRTWYSVQGANVDTAFADPTGAPPPTPAQVQIINDVVVQVVSLWLQNAGVDTTGLSLISTPFTADGTGIDSVLDQTSVDTSTNTVTIQDDPTSPTTTQTTTLTLNSTDSSVTVDTTTTSGSTTSSSSSTTTVPTSNTQTTAFDDIQAALNDFAAVVNAKGTALTSDDILPFTATDLLDQGQDQATFAASLVTDLRGKTLSLQLNKVTSLDTTAGTAHAYFDATISQGGQSQVESVDFYLTNSGTAWLISGDRRLASISVDAEMRTNQGGFIGQQDGPDINVDIRSPQGSLSSVAVDGGPFSNQLLSVSQNRIETYEPVPGTTYDVNYDAYFTNTGVLQSPVPAGTPINVTVTPTGGTAETYTFAVNAFTTDAAHILTPTGSTLSDANLGGTLNVTWTLPTTYAIKEVKLDFQLFDGAPDNALTNNCSVEGSILSPTATSGSISAPNTCGGNPVVNANLNLNIRGVNGERSIVIYEFQ